MKSLFNNLKAIYGSQWSKNFDSEQELQKAMDVWGKCLCRFTNMILAEALKQCIVTYKTSPTLPRFFDICVKKEKQHIQSIDDANKQNLRIEFKNRNRSREVFQELYDKYRNRLQNGSSTDERSETRH